MANYILTAQERRQLNIRIQDLTAQFDSYQTDEYYRQLGKLTNMLRGIEKFDGLHFAITKVTESNKQSDLVTVFFFTDVDSARSMKMALQLSLGLVHQPNAMRLLDDSQPQARRLRVDDITRESANAIVQANPEISHYEVKQHVSTNNNSGARRGRPVGSKNKPKVALAPMVTVTATQLAENEITSTDIAEIAAIELDNNNVLYCGKTEDEIIAEYPQADHSATFEELLSRMDKNSHKQEKVTTHVVIEEASPDVFTEEEIVDMCESATDHNVVVFENGLDSRDATDTSSYIEADYNISMMPESCITEDNEDEDLESWEQELLNS